MEAKILLVDDDSLIHELLEAVLHGFNFSRAYNGREAIEIMRNEKIGLVITDLQMPIMDGMELCRSIREEYGRQLPVILCSGAGREIFPKEFDITSYFDEIIPKPIEIVILRKKVNELLVKSC